MLDAGDFKIERRRVRYARIQISRDLQVRVTVPVALSREEVDALLQRKSRWIQKQLDNFRGRKDSGIALAQDEVLLLGEVYRFRLVPELRGKAVIDRKAKTISSGRNLLDAEMLEKWCRAKARRAITGRLAYYCRKYGLKYNRLFVRDQKTRWASCSARGNLSFNWRLIQAPMSVVDYLVVHELMHTRIMRHSTVFWAEIEAMYPDYRQAVRWLGSFHPH